MAEELEVKVEETAEAPVEATENKKETGKARRPRRDSRRPE